MQQWAFGLSRRDRVASWLLRGLSYLSFRLLTTIAVLVVLVGVWFEWRVLTSGYLWQAHAKTLAFAIVTACLAGLLAIPAAAILSGPSYAGRLIVTVCGVVCLAAPEPAWSYGWAEALRLSVGTPSVAAPGDWARAVVTSATQFWIVPAIQLAIFWAALPRSTMDAVTLDGGRLRMTLQILWMPLVGGISMAVLLATRASAVHDQSGLVTTSAVVRDVFTNGAGVLLPGFDGAASQGVRLRQSAVAGLPLQLMAIVCLVGAYKLPLAELDDAEVASRRSMTPWAIAAAMVLLGSIAPPVTALWVSAGLSRSEMLADHWPDLLQSLLLAGTAVAVLLPPVVSCYV